MITADQAETETNREIERKEIAWLHTVPDKVFLYVTMPTAGRHIYMGSRLTNDAVSWANGDYVAGCCRTAQKMHAMKCPVCQKLTSETLGKGVDITTWLGTPVATHVYVGPAKPTGGITRRWSQKRAVDCRINGVRYVGWFYQTSGDYCRLKKAKIQS